MAWTNSRVFRQTSADVWNNTTAFNATSDSLKTALYNNSITPDLNVTAANAAYNVAQWATANELFEAGQWAQGGVALTGQSLNVGTSDVLFFDANDPASGAAADISGAHGTLTYNDTLATPVADQGMCYNYLGGSNSVVNGTFTVVWSANGLWRATLS